MGQYKGKRKPDAAPTASRGGKTGFIPYGEMRFIAIELTSEEKDEFRALLAAGDIEPLDVTGYVTAGYEVTYKRDKAGGGVLLSLRAPLYELDNGGGIVTGRGGDAETALAVLSYKVQYLIGDRLWSEAEHERRGNAADIA